MNILTPMNMNSGEVPCTMGCDLTRILLRLTRDQTCALFSSPTTHSSCLVDS
ncbi:hypothetical protein DPMN_013689 [Dreissena polymorpha]|uniref:Uncharacterized protein n=1 Tax=Dreissena polymorpha TaxID=45954 RepID=A0A9D4N8C9_DREPO|nr:hypothetical protein DPMN_013689 [Dreissena polymorpha]